MRENFTKIIRPCKTDGGWTYCSIKFDDGILSITGVEGPRKGGNCTGTCGQIVMSELDVKEYGKDWDVDLVAKFREVWNRWHLNDLVPGTPKQMEYLRATPGCGRDYSTDCKMLEQANLLVDDGYKYGSGWRREEVPEDVIEWLMALPDSPTKPAWV